MTYPTATPVERLDAEALWRRCDPDGFDFETTAELDDLSEVIGQPRASEAVRFGIGIRGEGFHIFALGPEDTDKRSLVRHFVESRAAREEPPADLCYVNNFTESHRPGALRLPPGTGRELSADMERFLEELKVGLQAAFESDEYQGRLQAVKQKATEGHQEALDDLSERAKSKGLSLLRTPLGFVFAPMRGDEVLPPDELDKLSDDAREELEGTIQGLQEELQQILRQIPRRQREARESLRELRREMARFAVRDLLEELRARYADFTEVTAYFDAVERDVVDNVRELVESESEGGAQAPSPAGAGGAGDLRRYRVNVLVDHSESKHAPVLYEENPTFQNLVGRVEYQSLLGALVTDFTMIKAGALHRARGGYLILDARQVLLQPFAWEGLKRALQSGELRIESPSSALGLVSTVSLEPEPIPVDLKVVLLGSRMLYYLLSSMDPDFPELFKVAADFADEMDRDTENEALYARLLSTLARRDDLRPLDRSAVARVIERSARLVGDSAKLSVRTRTVRDLLNEADYWAAEGDSEVISGSHVQQAIEHWIYRSDRMREEVQEQIERDTIYIDTEGATVGQVNGLSVLQLGSFAFGRPSRITARVQLGSGQVLDIEREVELGGPIHSKGVFILSGFLGGRYGVDRPLALSASLVFEQSYGGVEGDSASSAELYALLSAIAEVPVSQSFAVTGSVNQHGRMQPIGGVNEKIEGFFDVCRARGLTGEQGVLIPASNVKHLMVREDVREAVAEGRFHIFPVETVDQGMEILTGRPMGERDEEGRFPEATINYLVERRLLELAETRKEYAVPTEGPDDKPA